MFLPSLNSLMQSTIFKSCHLVLQCSFSISHVFPLLSLNCKTFMVFTHIFFSCLPPHSLLIICFLLCPIPEISYPFSFSVCVPFPPEITMPFSNFGGNIIKHILVRLERTRSVIAHPSHTKVCNDNSCHKYL